MQRSWSAKVSRNATWDCPPPTNSAARSGCGQPPVLAAEAVAALPVRSCVIDAEAIVCDDSGLAVFDLIRGHGRNSRAMLCAFDLLEVNGEDVRPEPIEDRKRRLAGLLRLPHHGIALNETYREDGTVIFKHACALSCEGIVSKPASRTARMPVRKMPSKA